MDAVEAPYPSTNNYDKQSQPAKSLVLEKKTKCLKNLSFQTEKKKRSRKSNKEKNLLPNLGNCPTIRNGVVCRGILKEYQKKTGKQDKNGKDLKATYLRCSKKGCQSYHSLSKKDIINKLSLPGTNKNLEALYNREKLKKKKKISTHKNKTPAAKGYNRKNQGKAKKKFKKDIKDVVNKNEKEMKLIKKKNICKTPKKLVCDSNPKEKVNKQLYEIAVNDLGEDKLNQGPKLRNDFIFGQFVVRKTDMIDIDCPPIWRITNFGFLQKYLPFKKKGKLLYKGVSTFAGWIPRVINQYYLAPITFTQHTSKYIQFHKDQVEMGSVIEYPTEEELTGVLEEALYFAVSQKILKSQHETGGPQVNSENVFKGKNSMKVSIFDIYAKDSNSIAETSDNYCQPDKNPSVNKNKLGTTVKVTNKSLIQDLNQKSTQSPINAKCQNHVQEIKQNQQLDDNDICDPEINLPGQIPNVNSSNEFTIGSFIVNKTDVVDNNFPTLWKITNFGLLQKYCPFKEDDKMLYSNTLTYCSWNSEEKNHYFADVSTIKITQKDHIIKLNKIMRDLAIEITVLEESTFLKPALTQEEKDLIKRVLF